MGFKFVFLWTDLALWALYATLAAYVWHVSRQPQLRSTWTRALHDGATLASAVVLAIFLLISALDSVHFRRTLAPTESQAKGVTFYDTHTTSVLDLLLAGPTPMW